MTNVTATGTSGTFASDISNLTPGTAYSVAAYATTSQGTVYTATVPFTTATPATPPTVTTPIANNITDGSATLGGTVTGDGGDAITERGIVFAPTTVNSNPQLDGVGVTIVANCGTLGAFTVGVTNLTAGMAYSFKAYATNSVDTDYSATGTFTMLLPYTYTTAAGAVTITGYTGTGGVVNVPATINGLPVTIIGSNAFGNCSTLGRVNLPDGLTTIGDLAFLNCSNLSRATIPTSVTSIGLGAFVDCPKLTSITIPAGVTSIENYAFLNCTSLASALFQGNAPTMGFMVFSAVAPGFKVYYFDGSTGFSSPPLNAYPTVNNGPATPLSGWLATYGLPSTTDVQTSPQDDGVSILLAYALNLDPTMNQSALLPAAVCTGNQLKMSYYAASAGVTYTVQTSGDLTAWITTGVSLSAPDAIGVRTASVPMTGPSRYMRLVVSVP